MNRLWIISIACLLLGGWFLLWRSATGEHVARIENSIMHYNQLYKTNQYRATIKVADIHRAGFPFSKKVILESPELSMIIGQETFSVSLPSLTLTLEDAARGRYSVTMPNNSTALYALPNRAPEQYAVNIPELPVSEFAVCADKNCVAKSEDVLQNFSAIIPKQLQLNVTHEGKTHPVLFNYMMAFPVSLPIPQNISSPMMRYISIIRNE